MLKKSYNDKDKFNTWLAGVIDGDGYFYISVAGLAQFELTTGTEDERMLLNIKATVGGIIRPRAGARAIRLRIHKQELIRNLLHRVNGHIRNPKRWSQFVKLCDHFTIHAQKAGPLTNNCAYIAGLFDADGSISISVSRTAAEYSTIAGGEGKILRLMHSRGHNQLCLKITSSFKQYVIEIQQALGCGTIVEQASNKSSRHPHVIYHWHCSNREHCFAWVKYILQFPLRSSKQKRMLLLGQYFEIKQKKYHLSNPNTNQFLVWKNFCKQWFNFY